jgi:hypothetical protein
MNGLFLSHERQADRPSHHAENDEETDDSPDDFDNAFTLHIVSAMLIY